MPNTAAHRGITLAYRDLLPTQPPWPCSAFLLVGSLAGSCFLTLTPLALDTVPRVQALAAVPMGMGCAWGRAEATTAQGRAPAALGVVEGRRRFCVGRVLAVLCTGCCCLLSLLAGGDQAQTTPPGPQEQASGGPMCFWVQISVAAGTGRANESCTQPRQLYWSAQKALSPMGCHWLRGEALEGNREAVPTSALNQHVQELVHLLTSCHLLQQTTKRRVEGVRRRVPPATSQEGGSRPHKQLSPMQERCHTNMGLAVAFR